MAGKGNVYHEKRNIWKDILYYFVVVCLLAALGLMYKNWQGRKAEYVRMVQEASEQDQSINIELRKTFEENPEDISENGN